MSEDNKKNAVVVHQPGALQRIQQAVLPLAEGVRALLGNMVGGAVSGLHIKDGATAKSPMGSSATAWTEIDIEADPKVAQAMAEAQANIITAQMQADQARSDGLETAAAASGQSLG